MSDTPKTNALRGVFASLQILNPNEVLSFVRDALIESERMERENADLRAKLEEATKDAQAIKAATYSHVDGRDLLHELQPNGAHHIDILVRING